MNRTECPQALSSTVAPQAGAQAPSAPMAVHPAWVRAPRWPALALAVLLTGGVLAGADGLARHEAHQARVLAASWSAQPAPVSAQATAQPRASWWAQLRRNRTV